MVDDKKKTLEMLAEKLKVWPKDTNEELHPDGWRWVLAVKDPIGVAVVVLLKNGAVFREENVIHKSDWEEGKRQTLSEFIMNRFAEYYGPAFTGSEVFNKIIVDALIDWEAEQNG